MKTFSSYLAGLSEGEGKVIEGFLSINFWTPAPSGVTTRRYSFLSRLREKL